MRLKVVVLLVLVGACGADPECDAERPCGPGSVCVSIIQGPAFCAPACDASGACPAALACETCLASGECPTCRVCVQACVVP